LQTELVLGQHARGGVGFLIAEAQESRDNRLEVRDRVLAAVHGDFDDVLHIGDRCDGAEHVPSRNLVEVSFAGFLE